MGTKQFLLLMGALSMLGSCLSDSAPKESVGSAPLQSNAGTEKPELLLFVTTVDNLLLREQPNKQGKVIDKFREGDFVTGSGEISTNKEEVVLRDIPYNEPYFKVSSTLRQFPGWAYGGGLVCLYAGPKNGSPVLSGLSQYSKFLRGLDPKKLDSGKRCLDFLEQNFAASTGSEADASFILTEHFLRRMEMEGEYYNQTERHNWSQADFEAVAANRFDMNQYPVTRKLAENGFRLEMAEGMLYPVVDWERLQSFFSEKCSTAMSKFIAQRVEEQLHQEYDDGGIIIPLEQVADRVVFWENFNKENPHFPLKEETRASEIYGRQVLVTGADNTPTYDYETKAILKEFRNMWDYVVAKYPGTETAALVKQMQDICAAESWKRTEKVEAFTAKVLGIEMGLQ